MGQIRIANTQRAERFSEVLKDDQREFELQALLKMMKPCYPDLTEKDLRDAPWDLVRALEKALLNEVFLPRTVRWSMIGLLER